jgi:hypothetical protein
MDEQKNNIEYDIADVVIGRPYGFSVGHKHFNLYPVTLAKMYLLKRQIDSLEVNYTNLIRSPYVEALRLVTLHRETCCHIIAYHTAPNTYKDLYDRRSITIRKNCFEKELTDEEMATLLIMVLTADKTEKYMQHLGIDKERERMQKVMEVKRRSDSNNISFGGMSVFGTFIGQLKEMGYSDNEILYENGYAYLRLMLADKVTSIYLTDDEKAQVPAMQMGGCMDASDPANAESILIAFQNKGVKAQEE